MQTCHTKSADQFVIRLPNGWRDVIKNEAKRNHRPMNGEILAAIQNAFAQRGIDLAIGAANEKGHQGCNPDGLDKS